ncbi:MAG TPA: PEP-CTERM sorting domain-containing protein [Tepidisphaeraceae bacterium]|nr:PEP-CTERM sorting domain-containing protein [Tepidisphaeraceae bacterium]
MRKGISAYGAIALAVAFCLMGGSAQAAVVVLDDFETNEGHFALAPSFSGTSTGFTAASSTADRTTEDAFRGTASERIFIDDNPAAAVPTSNESWRLRFLSGSGTPANNVTIPSSGYVGYWLKTTQENLRAAIMIDDGAALERSSRLPIIADGQWHLYQWDLDDAAMWDAFAGTAPNGAIDADSVTIDSLFVDVLTSAGTDVDALFFIDDVSHNAEGVIPEPTGLAVIGLGGLVVLARRRRA